MRFRDRILAAPSITHYSTEGFLSNALRDLKERAVVFATDNVTKFVFEENSQEEWGSGDFPDLKPPFPCCFFESRNPSFSNSEGKRVPFPKGWWGDLVSLEGEQVNVCRFVEFENEVFFLPIVFSIVLLADGKYSTDRMIVVAEADGQRGLDAATASKSAWETAMGWGPQAGTFFALSLLHCKNVSTTTHDPPAAVVRKRLRYGREALTTFKTLEIGSVTKQINENNPGGADGLSRALHMCRGHFKEFAPEKPLFGRLAGRFWWPSHARGNIASGQIIKDYAVKP